MLFKAIMCIVLLNLELVANKDFNTEMFLIKNLTSITHLLVHDVLVFTVKKSPYNLYISKKSRAWSFKSNVT